MLSVLNTTDRIYKIYQGQKYLLNEVQNYCGGHANAWYSRILQWCASTLVNSISLRTTALAVVLYLGRASLWKFLGYCYRYLADAPSLRHYISDQLGYEKGVDSRSKFHKHTWDNTELIDSTHTHPIDASMRTRARLAIFAFIEKVLKREVYEIGTFKPSKGEHDYYWAKDYTIPACTKVCTENHAIALIDVDYYLDLDRRLNSLPLVPVVIYTIVPEEACGMTGNTSFTFKEDGSFSSQLSGGSSYEHPLWSYSGDCITLWSPISLTSSIYRVERRAVAQHRAVLLLDPVRRLTGMKHLLSTLLVQHNYLTRFKPITNGFIVFDVLESEERKTTLARAGTYRAITLKRADLDTLLSLYKHSKTTLHVATLQGYLPSIEKNKLPILADYIRTETKYWEISYPGVRRVIHYQKGKEYDPEAPKTMLPFGNNIAGEAYAPDLTKDNERSCLQVRLLEPMKFSESHCVTIEEVEKYIDEFSKLFIRDFKLIPWSEEQVREKQPRPAQQLSLETAETRGVLEPDQQTKVSAFQKSETYPEDKAPRNISTVDPQLKCQYSRYVYPLSEHLKTEKWYAFGKTPRQVADTIVSVIKGAKEAVETDFSKFDGHKSYLFCALHKAVFMACVPESERETILHLYANTKDRECYTKMGINYYSGPTQLSGSPDTACFNSIDNKFVDFYGRRLQGMAPSKAYKGRGIFGGDDGLSTGLQEKFFILASNNMGLKVTSNVVKTGSPVTFLARYYPDPWNGSVESCLDVARQVPKFFVSSKGCTLSDEDKLVAKCIGIWLNDRNSPVLGPLATKVMNIKFGEPDREKILTYLGDVNYPGNPHLALLPWHLTVDFDEHYPNNVGPEVWETVKLPIDVEKFEMALSRCNTLYDLLNLPFCGDEHEPTALESNTSDKLVDQTVATDAELKDGMWITAQSAKKKQLSKPTKPKTVKLSKRAAQGTGVGPNPAEQRTEDKSNLAKAVGGASPKVANTAANRPAQKKQPQVVNKAKGKTGNDIPQKSKPSRKVVDVKTQPTAQKQPAPDKPKDSNYYAPLKAVSGGKGKTEHYSAKPAIKADNK